MNESIFDKLDFGPLRAVLDDDDITDVSFDNNGQIWIRSLKQGSLRVEIEGVTPEFIEKLAFQCSNVMGTTFNNAKPFLDAESAELRLNFVHQSIATNGIAMVIRKTPAKIRLEKEKLLKEDYFTEDIHNILIKCVEGHCNIIVCGETGSGKTEFVKYLASHTKTNEKIITIEDTLELHLDKIFPQRDIVAMKTNNVASYTDVLVTCMRQNPKWILLSEVRSAEAVSAVRNSISSGHNILSTIHADKASAIPYRLYSLMETDLDVNQFLNTIYRYIQLGVHIKAYYSKERGQFHREVDEVVEFYVDENNEAQSHIIYQKQFGKNPTIHKPSAHLIEYLSNQNIDINDITSNIKEDDPFEYNAEQTIEKTILGADIPIEQEPEENDESSDDTETTSTEGETKVEEESNEVKDNDMDDSKIVDNVSEETPNENESQIQPSIEQTSETPTVEMPTIVPIENSTVEEKSPIENNPSIEAQQTTNSNPQTMAPIPEQQPIIPTIEQPVSTQPVPVQNNEPVPIVQNTAGVEVQQPIPNINIPIINNETNPNSTDLTTLSNLGT